MENEEIKDFIREEVGRYVIQKFSTEIKENELLLVNVRMDDGVPARKRKALADCLRSAFERNGIEKAIVLATGTNCEIKSVDLSLIRQGEENANGLFRTTNGFIFEGKAEIGEKFIHESCNRLDEEDEVICVGERLKDLIRVGDIVEYDFEEAGEHVQWLLAVKDGKVADELKGKRNFVVKRIFHKLGNVYVESPILPKEATKRPFWALGDRS